MIRVRNVCCRYWNDYIIVTILPWHKYDGQEPNKIDWYNSETYCRQSDIQGDIAYSYLDDYSSTNSVRLHLGDDDDDVKLWIGVRKRIWFWKKGKVISNYTENKSFSYVYIILSLDKYYYICK